MIGRFWYILLVSAFLDSLVVNCNHWWQKKQYLCIEVQSLRVIERCNNQDLSSYWLHYLLMWRTAIIFPPKLLFSSEICPDGLNKESKQKLIKKKSIATFITVLVYGSKPILHSYSNLLLYSDVPLCLYLLPF